ncbi:hypothetical protein BGM26_07305 [Bacillus sp. FJAT-29790]|uniref:replicative helicase loader/inhibitor n=1 Tax=Bacillus sp. FJAT-29790 TaxID=1895002 RepID=UPI001C228C1A|nr:replicative helicase loader/inhibitor [Bacillus sp. FJAT-29790]MBU8878796.1 hypothetical protein [Bacillus sp. FJAT-29790]
MTKREAFTLLALISVYYEQFELDQEKVDSWHKILKDYTVDQLRENLLAYVAESPYPPKVSDLIKKPAVVSRAIPNCADTAYILKIDWKPASEEVVKRELAKMREILGISRGEG